MNLGQFSVSLAVKDIAKSRAFYETLGFTVYDGKQAENWLIMKHGDAVIGLFQGMFDANILTFNPKDVRSIETHLLNAGVELKEKTQGNEGPAFITFFDPDGNSILIDQHDPDYTAAPETID